MEEQGYALGKGVLPTSIVTRLSGVSAARLLRWRRLGLIRASVVNGRRGVPIVYSWADYQRIRAAAALVRAGSLPARCWMPSSSSITTRRTGAHASSRTASATRLSASSAFARWRRSIVFGAARRWASSAALPTP